MIPEKLLKKFETNESWLVHKSELHGVAHMTRVFILQELICEQLVSEGAKIDRKAVRFAAMAHDVGRVNDGTDPDHGRRSAEWMKRHLAEFMTPETIDLATYAVHWHVPPDHSAPVMTPELMALKDADGLDRVRLGDLDVDYLRTEAAVDLAVTAEELYVLSIKYRRNEGKPAFLSVLYAAVQLGLISSEAPN